MRNLGQTMERHGYQATFIKVDCYGNLALLYAIMDERHIQICDHVWVRVGPWCEQLEPGSVITFTAVPIKYVKQNQHTTHQLEVDVTLSDIEDLRKVGEIEIHKVEHELPEESDDQG